MARKKKIQIERHPGVPRGAEHVAEKVLAGDLHPRLTPEGAEILSTEPIVLRVGRRTVTDLETLRAQIQAIRAHDGPVEFETFAEADDFDVEDDFGQFTSRWELPADQPSDVSVEDYIRFRTTGEIPSHLLQDGPRQDGPDRPASGPGPKIEDNNSGKPAEKPGGSDLGKQ